MTITIPKSLYNEFVLLLKNAHYTLTSQEKTTVGSSKLIFYGPYGSYEVVAQDDELYTVEEMKPVRSYK